MVAAPASAFWRARPFNRCNGCVSGRVAAALETSQRSDERRATARPPQTCRRHGYLIDDPKQAITTRTLSRWGAGGSLENQVYTSGLWRACAPTDVVNAEGAEKDGLRNPPYLDTEGRTVPVPHGDSDPSFRNTTILFDAGRHEA